jgi:hypothetical protein
MFARIPMPLLVAGALLHQKCGGGGGYFAAAKRRVQVIKQASRRDAGPARIPDGMTPATPRVIAMVRRALIITTLCARLFGCVELEKRPDPPGTDMSSSGVVCQEVGDYTICKDRDQRKAEGAE